MKLKRGLVIGIIIAVLVIVLVIVVINLSNDNKNDKAGTVKVERKNIVEKALAVGTIDPETEIQVK